MNQVFNVPKHISLDQFNSKLIQDNRQRQHYLLNYQKNKTTQYLPFEEEENEKRLSVLDEFSDEDSDYYVLEVSSDLSYDPKMGGHCSNELDDLSLANLTKDNNLNKLSDSMITDKSVELLKSKEPSRKQSTPLSNKKCKNISSWKKTKKIHSVF